MEKRQERLCGSLKPLTAVLSLGLEEKNILSKFITMIYRAVGVIA